jgi:hypothetical protein
MSSGPDARTGGCITVEPRLATAVTGQTDHRADGPITHELVVALEVVTTSGRAAAIELRLTGQQVEIRHHGNRVAVLERDLLRRWLAGPRQALAVEGITFSLDRAVDVQGRVAISLPDVRNWTLSPTELHTLRRRL